MRNDELRPEASSSYSSFIISYPVHPVHPCLNFFWRERLSRESLIVVESVTKRYGETLAVDGVSLRVGAGGVYALVGAEGGGEVKAVSAEAGPSGPGGGHDALWRAGQKP